MGYKGFRLGKVISTIHKTFSFEQMREAHTEVEKGGLVGKVVVLVKQTQLLFY